MAEIEAFEEGNFREIKVVGVLRLNDAVSAVEQVYAASQPAKYILWNLTRASAVEMTSAEIRELAKATASLAHSRGDGKTAIMSSKDLEFGLSRMFSVFAEFEPVPFELRVFRDREACLAWFGIDSDK